VLYRNSLDEEYFTAHVDNDFDSFFGIMGVIFDSIALLYVPALSEREYGI